MSDSMIKIPGYKIEREIGRGGMSTVYLALQESLNRKVALKVMKPALGADEDFKTRFLNEGHIVGQLNHSNIVTVFDIGTHDNHYYLSMQYLPGGSLHDRIRKGLTVRESLEIARTLGKALHYAHQRDFVHRDIKPLNVLFREDDSPVLTDFGIAKALNSSITLTCKGFTLGSLGYMSPEQALSKPIDHRSDIYSLGVVLWEMLTGQKLYQSDDAISLVMKHATAPIPQLPDKLHYLQPLLERLLAKKADDRFEDMRALVSALDRYLPYNGGLLPDPKRAQSKARVAIAAILGLMVIGGGTGWWWLSTSLPDDAHECYAAPTRNCLFDLALGIAHNITDATERAALLEMLTTLRDQGHRAHDSAHGGQTDHDVHQRVHTQIKAGQIDAALTTARSLDDPDTRNYLIATIAAASDRLEVALALTRGISDPRWRALAYTALAKAQAAAGDSEAAQAHVATAMADARSIDTADLRASVLHTIAVAQAEAGSVTTALTTVQEIESLMGRSSHVAQAYGAIAALLP